VRQYGISIARQKSIAVKKSSLRQKKKASNSTKVPDKGGECSSLLRRSNTILQSIKQSLQENEIAPLHLLRSKLS